STSLALQDLPSFPTRRSSDLKVRRRHGHYSPRGGLFPEHHNAVRLIKWQRFEEHRITDAKNSRIGADSEGQRDCCRHRKTGILRSEEHTSELQSRGQLVCRLL